MTTIGGGLEAARLQFPAPLTNPRAILLMTDGLENTPPMVASAEPALSGITVHAIGFGSESSLNGALLTALTGAHAGMYMRAGGGLALEKFFSSAFGNIFEAGVLMDPEFDLPADQRTGDAVPFRVCGEETITLVAGWDRSDTSLFLEVASPGGAVLTSGSPGVESESGRTWTFLRIQLPVNGERDGLWKVNVARPGGGEFPPPAVALRYFINIIPFGGPIMLRIPDERPYYTGDAINPIVMVRYANGGWPDGMRIALTVTRPDGSVGNILSQYGLGSADADSPARQATGKPVVNYQESVFDLSSDSSSTRGLFEESGTFGKEFSDLLTVEGNYTFHGSSPASAVVDLGNGSYQVDVCTDPGSLEPPRISLGQPGRPPVVVGGADSKRFIYSVNFVCGGQQSACCGCSPLRSGQYSTEINILNTGDKEVPVQKRVIPLVLAGAASGREPKFNGPGQPDLIRLPPHSATMDDCCRLLEMMLGATPSGPVPLTTGILEIISTVELSVTAIYTASEGGVPSIDVQQIRANLLHIRNATCSL